LGRSVDGSEEGGGRADVDEGAGRRGEKGGGCGKGSPGPNGEKCGGGWSPKEWARREASAPALPPAAASAGE